MTYEQNDLVQIAKRDNNQLRPYLLVNPLQGKHMPIKPSTALHLFHGLSRKLHAEYAGRRLLIIGFAETATAIASAVAAAYPEECWYIQTTREPYPAASCLYFREEHSHAAEQKLLCTPNPDGLSLRDACKDAEFVIFAEDEVTTGNTILNGITAIKAAYPDLSASFGIASILNSMPESRIQEFAAMGIRCTYLLACGRPDYAQALDGCSYPSGLRHPVSCTDIRYEEGMLPMPVNPRFITTNRIYEKACLHLAACLTKEAKDLAACGDCLVLGTEEFMYPALKAAESLEKFSNVRVFFHASTRSPILPSTDPGYPLKERYALLSPYDPARITYLYNLQNYDRAFILHDAPQGYETGLRTMYAALQRQGIHQISAYRAG